MICENCGQKIDSLRVNVFMYDGSDYWAEILIDECEENAVVIETTRNWTGYELTEDEMHDTITCPACKKWPFKSQEIQIYEPLRLVMFKEEEGET